MGTPDHRTLLHEAQARARRLRCEAFVNYAPILAGTAIRPITLESYNHLLAFESPYVTGGEPGLEDMFAFLWVHHPDFGQAHDRARRCALRAFLRHVTPRWPTLNGFIRFLAPFPRFRFLRRFIRPTHAERVAEVDAEIRRLLTEALGEFPSGPADETPLPFSFQAQVLNLMRRELHLTFAETRALPLKQLAQHLRELIHTASAGRALLLTPEEAAIWRDWLDSFDRKPAPAA